MFFKHFSVIFGEDVAFGGVFRCTVGLRDKYGKLIFLYMNNPVEFLLNNLENANYSFLIVCYIVFDEWVPFNFHSHPQNPWPRFLLRCFNCSIPLT